MVTLTEQERSMFADFTTLPVSLAVWSEKYNNFKPMLLDILYRSCNGKLSRDTKQWIEGILAGIVAEHGAAGCPDECLAIGNDVARAATMHDVESFAKRWQEACAPMNAKLNEMMVRVVQDGPDYQAALDDYYWAMMGASMYKTSQVLYAVGLPPMMALVQVACGWDINASPEAMLALVQAVQKSMREGLENPSIKQDCAAIGACLHQVASDVLAVLQKCEPETRKQCVLPEVA
jgi:hypothetical protein